MYRLMTLSFLFLGWGFYELSGGPDFAPATTEVAAPILISEDELQQIDATRLLIASTVADVASEDSFGTPEIVMRSSMDFTRPAGVDGRDGLEELTDIALVSRAPLDALPALDADIRQVTGNRVNMRGGPGTSHPVLVTLDGGTKLEVIGQQGSWANVRFGETTGWMSVNLLDEI